MNVDIQRESCWSQLDMLYHKLVFAFQSWRMIRQTVMPSAATIEKLENGHDIPELTL